MAERYTHIEAPIEVHPTEIRIHEHFDRIIECANRRREEMIEEFRDRMEEKRAAETGRIRTLHELMESKAELQDRMRQNVLLSMRERITEEIDAKMRDLQETPRETELVFECDTLQLQQRISVLGQLIKRDVISTPDYPALLQPSISVGKKELAEGELYSPRGVVFDEKSQGIYVANDGIKVGSGNISVFSVTGEYIDRFCEGQMSIPSGIAISGNNVFLSQPHRVHKFKLPTFHHVTKVGKNGTGVGEFNNPQGLTVATDGSVFVADKNNNRVSVMDTRLRHKHYITHETMTQPVDVKVNNNKLYVLSNRDSPCLHVFSVTGEKIRSLITRDTEGNAQVRRCLSLCFDKRQNILMADNVAQNIKVFSQEGALLHTLGDSQDEDNTIKPIGIALTENNKIICTSQYTKFALHIFQ